MSGVIIIAFSLLFIFMLMRVPIAISLAFSSIVGLLMINFNTITIINELFSSLNSPTLMAIPGFILAGAIMTRGGISNHLMEFLKAWLGHLPGGVAVVTVVGCIIFAAITGSSTATAAAVAGIMVPALKDANYSNKFSAGLIAAGGTLGILIPPSIPLILYSTLSKQSVAKLFAAGIIPGLLIGLLFIIYVVISSIINGEGRLPKETWGRRWKLGKKAIWGILLPVIILGGIYSGIMTPSESAVVAVFYALFISIAIYKDYSFTKFKDSLLDAARTTSMIMFIVSSSMIFSMFLTYTRIPHYLIDFIFAVDLNKWQLLIIISVFLLILGTFMDGVSIMLITAPLLIPIVIAADINLIHFAIIMTVNLELALITPPIGMNLFLVSSASKVSIKTVIMGVIPFGLIIFISLILVTIFPGLSLWITQFIN